MITKIGNIQEVPLNQTLPLALTYDERIAALSAALSKLLQEHARMITRVVGFYYRIDELDDRTLDILASDFKIDWWNYDYTVEQKRAVLKNSWKVHRMKGTRAAVEIAVSAIYPDTKILEWFEYAGNPYFFKLQIDITNQDINTEKHKKLLEEVDYYKTVRSRLEDVTYTIQPKQTTYIHAGGTRAGQYMRMCVKLKIPQKIDYPHGIAKANAGVRISGVYTRMEVKIRGMG